MPASRKRSASRPKPKKTARASTPRKTRAAKRPARRASARKKTARPSPVAVVAAVPAAIPSPEITAVAPVPSPAASAPSRAPAARRIPWRGLAAFFVFALLMTAVGGFIISAVNAATWVGPTQAAPGGNVPGIIWNRVASGAVQTNAAISVDGGGPAPAAATGISAGASTLDLGVAAGGQNVYYGVADSTKMNAQDYLLLLQTFAGSYTTRFSVDGTGRVYTPADINGNQLFIATNASFGSASDPIMGAQNLIYGNVDVTSTGSLMLLQNESVDKFRVNARGDVKAAGCFGKTFVGFTASVWPGNIGSYYAADNKCGIDFPGSHVCKVDEMLESIACSVPGDPIRVNGGSVAWINGGPPGDPSKNANDCIGWTSNASSAYGRVWVFDNTTGGKGTLTGCNVGGGGLKYSCCR